MDEKVKYYEKRLGFGTFWTDSHIKDLLSHISTLEAQLAKKDKRIEALERELDWQGKG